MPRTRRGDLPDGMFHVMTHAVDGGKLFRRDCDRKMYLGLLQLASERHRWTVLTFALMDNHVHVLVLCTTKQLSAGLWWLHWRYAEYYKRTYEPRFGHVFAGRPKTKPIRTHAYFLAVVRYIARNPVPALCSRPEDYGWSAHRVLVSGAPDLPMLARDELLAWFGPGDAAARYERFVCGEDPDEHRNVRDSAHGPAPERPDLEGLVADRTGASFRVAHETWGYSIRAIARAAGLSHTTVRRAIARART